MKRFLACSGGGDRGIIIMGMLLEIFKVEGKEAVCWDELAGISVGALCVSFLSQLTPSTFEPMLKKIVQSFLNSEFTITEPWVWGGSVINMIDAFLYHQSMFKNSGLKKLIHQWFDDKKSIVPFSVGVYNKTKKQYESYRSDSVTDIKRYILASASVPVVFPEVEIDGDKYQDGGMGHIIPVREIENWLKKTSGPRHIDVILCFPINKPDIFIKMTTPVTALPILNSAAEMVSDLELKQFQADIKLLADIIHIPVEELTKNTCGKFIIGDLTIQILSPDHGKFTSMINMTKQQNQELLEEGIDIVKKYLKL